MKEDQTSGLQSKGNVSGNEPAELNDYHRRRLRVTFQHVDSILNEVEQILADLERRSPFCPYSSDLNSTQRKIVLHHVARVRETMAAIMKAHAIPFAQARCGERWAALTALLGASISIEELTLNQLKGYGDLPPEGASLLTSIRAELSEALEDLQNYLKRC
jgi:hypothetical protein